MSMSMFIPALHGHQKKALFGAPARWSGAKSMTWTTLSRTESETSDTHDGCFYFE